MIKERDGYSWTPQPKVDVRTYATEEQLQNACYMWFHNSFPAWRKMLFHVDNNSWNATIGAKKKALGVNAGVSDMILISFVETLFLECKLPGEYQSPDQIEFEAKVKERGHKYIVFKYLSHFQMIVMEAIISR
jgi:hypothetical protein